MSKISKPKYTCPEDQAPKQKEDKFIVINRKRFDEIEGRTGAKNVIDKLQLALNDFSAIYEIHMGKPIDQQYIVCNQDEPYAEKVWDLILARKSEGGEDE